MLHVLTKDGSLTFFNKQYGETYHAISGAEEEAIKKYAEPCRIAEYMEITILDICFGLGYNSAAALDAFKGGHIKIIGLENDEAILKEITGMRTRFASYPVIQNAVQNGYAYSNGKISIALFIGDAKKTIKKAAGADVVFFDPFSPKKCPELWTADFFKDIMNAMKPGGILATYSCARAVRDNLRTAGFRVADGPCVGRKAPSTIAYKCQKISTIFP